MNFEQTDKKKQDHQRIPRAVNGFTAPRVSKKIQQTYSVVGCKIDSFWDDVIYAEEEEEDAGEGKNTKYKRYKNKK